MREIFSILQKERQMINAPVDTMGCTCIPFTNDSEEKRFRILIMLMLSPQTKDQITFETVHKLNEKMIKKYGCGLSKNTICLAPISFLEENLRKVNFYKTKTKNIHKIAFLYRNIPLPTEHCDLIKLPGIGNKIAFLYLQHACNKVVGISVDTHVHRIVNRIGIIKTKNAERTRQHLENIFHKKDWIEINKVLVGYGQTICAPKKPDCSNCKISHLCKYGQSLDF